MTHEASKKRKLAPGHPKRDGAVCIGAIYINKQMNGFIQVLYADKGIKSPLGTRCFATSESKETSNW